MHPIVIDFETSISKGVHGADFRDPNNDFYTVITGKTPDSVQIMHKKEGFGRKFPLEQELLTSDLIIGHNLGFDLAYIWYNECLKKFLLRGGKIWDTQVAEFILTAQQHQFASLAELQLKYLGQKEKPSRISYLFSKGIGADKIISKRLACPKLFKLYEHYCQLDGSTTLKIFKQQYIRAKQENMLNIIQLYNDYLLALVNMSCTGIQLDVKLCEKTLTDFNLKHIEYLERAQDLIKHLWSNPRLPTFNINSPDHKSAILFGGEIKNVLRTKVGKYKNGNDKYSNVEHKIWVSGFQVPKTLTKNTKKAGVYATDVDVMQKIAANTKNEAVRTYCELQREAMMYKKAAKTYVEAFIKLNVGGVLYPNFNNVATTTGRLSSSKPNMQNVSKRNKFGKDLHRLFVAPRGWKAMQIDFNQLEIWVMAWLSGDKTLQKQLLAGTDLHCVRVGYSHPEKTYEEIYKLCKIDQDPVWTKKRTNAKTVSYQMAYGAMPPKVSSSTGLPIEDVELIFQKEAETYPDTIKLGESVIESAKKTATFSREKDIPNYQKKGINGSKFYNGIELLPVFDKDGKVSYNKEYYRKIGFWRSPTGKKYHFLQSGRVFQGRVNSSFSFTQPKNYPMQGTAADIQGATTAEILPLLLNNPDKIKMINEVHDSKWFYIKEECLPQIIEVLRDKIENVGAIFARRFGVDVPFRFPVDFEVGDNFADMTSFKLEEGNSNDNEN